MKNKVEIQPVMDALEIIGGKWKFAIIYALCHGTLRFNQLRRELGRVTPKALFSDLQQLELNGLVSRRVIATVPVTVEYSLTEYGKTLEPILRQIQAWGKKHRQKTMTSVNGQQNMVG